MPLVLAVDAVDVVGAVALSVALQVIDKIEDRNHDSVSHRLWVHHYSSIHALSMYELEMITVAADDDDDGVAVD